MASATRIAIDGHVHLQRNMPWDMIATNFASAAPGCLPLCIVTESAGFDRFSELATTCHPWGEHGLCSPKTGLYFVAGRQVVSAEGLEILVVGSRDQSTEGLPADRVIAKGLDSGAAICLPWGFGKWIGTRRQIAKDLHARLSMQMTLGDITNRPAIWPEPLFNGQRVLRGSDNLPMAKSSDTVGAFGSIIEASQPVQSAQQVIELLRDPNVPLVPFGERKDARASVGEQIRLRFNRGAA